VAAQGTERLLFENRLHVYFIWDPRIHAKLYHSAQQNRRLGGFTLSQKKAIQRSRKEHDTILQSLNRFCGALKARWRRPSLAAPALDAGTLENSSIRSTRRAAIDAPISRRRSDPVPVCA